MALIAEQEDPHTQQKEILAVGRLTKLHGSNSAEFAMLVTDVYQRNGLGTEILTRLMEIAKNEKISVIFAEILAENIAMQKVCQNLGFEILPTGDGTILKAEIYL
jgi:acetyltransferase